MKLEFLVAFKYLIPRKRNLSSSLISLLSIGIIALVVWLSVVFISVIHGLEQRWTRDLAALHAPISIVPSEEYYQSYYYHIDGYSGFSQYAAKSIGEKLLAEKTDPYDREIDFDLPSAFPKPDLNTNGVLKDPVKQAMKVLGPLLSERQAALWEFNEGMCFLRMQEPTSKFDPRTLTQFIAYTEDSPYFGHVLPYEGVDYTSEVLSLFNASPSGWREDFARIREEYRGESVVLPIQYRQAGYCVGDQGYLSVFSVQDNTEVQYPFRVIGFYEPGLSPLGGKTIFIDHDFAMRVLSEGGGTNGWHVFFHNIKQIQSVKAEIIKQLHSAEIASYWEVSSLYDYEFFKPILEQLQSDQVLFSLISVIIIIVACSNIMTMSILLVHYKKKEIGILKAMGISSRSLKCIFGFCGVCSGGIGVVLGTIFAMLTLKNLSCIAKGLSYIQGREAFNTTFFGQTLPQELHMPTAAWLAVGTIILATVSGALPARYVSNMSVSDILKSE